MGGCDWNSKSLESIRNVEFWVPPTGHWDGN